MSGSDSDAVNYRLMYDPEQVEQCGIIPMEPVVQSISDWAYRGRWGGCDIVSVTMAHVCVGQGSAKGRWRARFVLWPDNRDKCTPLCIKMSGKGDEPTLYGRTRTC